MGEQTNKERPEVYALRQNEGGWQISRRDFLKAAGISAAAVGISLNSRFVRPAAGADIYEMCVNSLAHGDDITRMLLSPDGNYLISRDSGGVMKCWSFDTYALLGTLKNAFSGKEPVLTGIVGGKEAVLSASSSYYELPVTSKSSGKDLFSSAGSYDSFVMDREENIYALQSASSVIMLKKADGYQSKEPLYSSEKKIRSIFWMENSGKLFLQMDTSFAVLDPASHEAKSFYGDCPVYAILPGDARILICGDSGCRLCSLVDGSMIWERDLAGITAAAVSPDGSIGIAADSAFHVWLISMKDGSTLHDKACGSKSDRTPQIAVGKDGTKFAFAVGKSILFFSLPDLEALGCPVDLENMKEDTQGIQVEQIDPVTHQTVTVTMPCGSPIPDGAVCICNCVAGTICNCDGHCTCDTVCSCVGHCTCDTVCSCVGHCTCNTVCTCDSQGGHYWHPN